MSLVGQNLNPLSSCQLNAGSVYLSHKILISVFYIGNLKIENVNPNGNNFPSNEEKMLKLWNQRVKTWFDLEQHCCLIRTSGSLLIFEEICSKFKCLTCLWSSWKTNKNRKRATDIFAVYWNLKPVVFFCPEKKKDADKERISGTCGENEAHESRGYGLRYFPHRHVLNSSRVMCESWAR